MKTEAEKKSRHRGNSLAAAAGLAVFVLAFFVTAVMPKGGNVKAEVTGGSSKGLTETDFSTITSFGDLGVSTSNNYSNPVSVSGNTLRLTDSSCKAAADGSMRRVGGEARLSQPISMYNSWKMDGSMTIPDITSGTGVRSNRIRITISGGGTSLVFETLASNGGNGNFYKIRVWRNGSNLTAQDTTISSSNFSTSSRSMVLSYNASTEEFYFSWGGGYKYFTSPFTKKTITYIAVEGLSSFQSGKKAHPERNVFFYFNSFRYTDYDMQIISSKLLDFKNREIRGPVGNGHTITVRNYLNSTGPAYVYYDASESENIGVSSDYKPSSGLNGKNIECDFKIKTAGPEEYEAGQKFKINTKAYDSYFMVDSPYTKWKKDFPLTADITNDLNRRLINKDKADDGDYDYTIKMDTNEFGWTKTGAEITMKSDDFNELNINNVAYPGNIAALTDDTPIGGTTFEVFGRKGNTVYTDALSAISNETIKIDQTPPTLTVYNRKTRTISAKDLYSGNSNKNGSGLYKIEWRKNGEGEQPWTVLKEYHEEGMEHGPGTDNTVQYELKELGSYSFRLQDYAGNYSDLLTITNTEPSLKAESKSVNFSDTKSGFRPALIHGVEVTDAEETISNTECSWTIEREAASLYPAEFAKREGTGTEALAAPLPLGKYTVTFTCKDSDGNSTEKKVTLYVNTDGAPTVIEEESGSILTVLTEETKPDSSRHTIVEGSSMIIADPEKPYSDGLLDIDEAAAEIVSRYRFVAAYSGGSLDTNVSILKNGVDFSSVGINTTKEGDYQIVYKAVDEAGNSATIRFTMQIREDYYVTFDPGKGDFTDGDTLKKETVKIGTTLDEKQIPEKTELGSPIERTFIGWNTEKNAASAIDPQSVVLKGDTTFYAVFAQDRNRDDVDDSLQALFEFTTSDHDNSAFPQTEALLIGITPGDGEKVSLEKEQIPRILKLKGYYLRGFTTDETGSKILTDDELCDEKRGAGTYTVCKAQFDYYTPVEETDVSVTFISSDPENAPFPGGDGQKIGLQATEEIPTHLTDDDIPKASCVPGYSLKGWKTDATGDKLLTNEELKEKNLYGGTQMTCVAYFDFDITKTDQPVTFTFYSSDLNHGALNSGNGSKVELISAQGKNVSLKKIQVPEVKLSENSTFEGWRTNLTGNKLLTTDQLCRLQAPAGKQVTCIAYSRYREPVPETDGNNAKDGETKSKDGKDNEDSQDKLPVVGSGGQVTEIKNVKFAFYSANTEKLLIKTGDGTMVNIPVTSGETVKLLEDQIPSVVLKEGSRLIGFKTNVTGNRILPIAELCRIEFTAGSTINCTACVDVRDVQVNNETDYAAGMGLNQKQDNQNLTTLYDEQVPLAARAGGFHKGKTMEAVRNCKVHFILLIWLVLVILTGYFRLHRRKKAEYDLPTGKDDWIFMIGAAVTGAVIVWLGQCVLEWLIWGAGLLLLILYCLKMKWLDRHAKEAGV